MRGKATGAHRPLPREKNLYLFSSFFTYTSKYQNDPLFAEVAFLPHARASVHEARACAERRPELIGHYCARKFVFIFLLFHLYIKISKCDLFFDWMSHNGSRIVSGQSASKRLKNRVKKWLVRRIRSNVIYRVRRRSIPAFNKFCAVYMTFLPLVSARPIEQVPQSIITIRLDVTNSFRKRLVNTNDTNKINFRLFHVATKTGNEDERRRERRR